MHAAIAQLDRVTDYESVGRGFESLLPYQKNQIPIRVSGFLFCKGLKRSNAARMSAAGEGLTEPNHNLLSQSKRKYKRVPFAEPSPYGIMDTWFHRDFFFMIEIPIYL